VRFTAVVDEIIELRNKQQKRNSLAEQRKRKMRVVEVRI